MERQKNAKAHTYMSQVYILLGDPIPLARPRLSGDGRRVYDSQRLLKHIFIKELQKQHAGKPLYTGPLHLDVTFYLRIPKSSIKRMESIKGQYHVFKPDTDNLVKFCGDISSMKDMDDKHVLMHDDCIISVITARKIYDLNPRTEFTITQLEPNGKK